MSSPLEIEHKSIERLAFEVYLRTGRRIDLEAIRAGLEAKYNHNHDPHNGQFTFSSGASGAGYIHTDGAHARTGHGPRKISRARRIVATGEPKPRIPFRIADRRNDGRPLPYLSPLHNEIRARAVGVPPEKGTEEWTPLDFAQWMAGGGNVHAFKRQWVHGYRNAIKAAAQRFDLPAGLVAGVAYTEVGGDPRFIDGAAYTVRDMTWNPKRDLTSIGDMSVQVRRAAQSLGYTGKQGLIGNQRAMLLSSLQDPQVGIFIAAKHLSDLRDVDFKGTPGSRLTISQIQVIASRYNQGPDLPRQQVEKNLSYGRSVAKRWQLLNQLVR